MTQAETRRALEALHDTLNLCMAPLTRATERALEAEAWQCAGGLAQMLSGVEQARGGVKDLLERMEADGGSKLALKRPELVVPRE